MYKVGDSGAVDLGLKAQPPMARGSCGCCWECSCASCGCCRECSCGHVAAAGNAIGYTMSQGSLSLPSPPPPSARSLSSLSQVVVQHRCGSEVAQHDLNVIRAATGKE